ncbi:MAG: hypothetical protein WD768_18850 [Phycisphaeraceae bacterium]
MTPAQSLIVDAMRAGVLLFAEGDRLRFKARAALPTELAERIEALKPRLLALLSCPAGQQFANDDAETDAGLPIYSSADEPLPAPQTTREAGAHALILTYSARRRVQEWLTIAGDNKPDAGLLADVLSDAREIVALVESVKRTQARQPTSAGDRGQLRLSE